MAVQLSVGTSGDLVDLLRLERRVFAAKLRVARAILGYTQSQLAAYAGLTQRAVHKLEQGDTEPRRATVYAIEKIWRENGLEFEDIGDGGFRVVVRAALLRQSGGERLDCEPPADKREDRPSVYRA